MVKRGLNWSCRLRATEEGWTWRCLQGQVTEKPCQWFWVTGMENVSQLSESFPFKPTAFLTFFRSSRIVGCFLVVFSETQCLQCSGASSCRPGAPTSYVGLVSAIRFGKRQAITEQIQTWLCSCGPFKKQNKTKLTFPTMNRMDK